MQYIPYFDPLWYQPVVLGWVVPAIMLATTIAGAISKKKAADRQNKQQAAVLDSQSQQNSAQTLASILTQQDRGRVDRAGLDLARRQFSLNAPDVRARQASRGDLMANVQPASISNIPAAIRARMPTISGGLTPAAFGPTSRQFGRSMAQQALMQQLAGDKFDPIPETDYSGILAMLKNLPSTALQNPGFLENLMGGIALGGSVAGGIANVYGQNQPYGPGGSRFDYTSPTPPPGYRG